MDSLNVSQFLAAYNASLADVLELRASSITGILEARSERIYRGELYWSLVDGGTRLTVRIPERYRDLSGRRVEVTGQPSRRIREDRGEIEVILRVQSITPLDPVPEDWIGPLLPIGEKRRSSWPAIERSVESRILAGDQPRVLMLFGVSSMVDKDVLAALGQYAQAYRIKERRIPMTDPAAVAAAFAAEKVDADLVAIVRGGGEGISALSDRQVIEAVARQVPIPIVSAVGLGCRLSVLASPGPVVARSAPAAGLRRWPCGRATPGLLVGGRGLGAGAATVGGGAAHARRRGCLL